MMLYIYLSFFMWKIIKQNIEQVKIEKKSFLLWMHGQFTIEFLNDRFWPYDYKFERQDCYFIDWLEDRGTVKFPLKNKEFHNTEIFLETDDIVVCTGERGGLLSGEKNFIDLINLKTDKKQRIFTDEVNVIYNYKDGIVVNANISWTWKTLFLDAQTLEIIKEKEEKLLAFFKCIYNSLEKNWYLLDFKKTWETYQDGFFELKEISRNYWVPKKFERENFLVNGTLDIWELSCK